MNFFRRFCIALTLFVSLIAAPGHATGRFDFARYRQCLRTPLVHFPGTIAQAADETEQLSTLFNLVSLAGLGGALSDPNADLTVFAPSNRAFDALPTELVNLLVANPTTLLTTVLTYHVSPGAQDPRRSVYPREVKTLQGQTVFLDYENVQGPQINQSTTSCQGVRTSNGIVWIIDSVLLPQFVPAR
ncbi:fasciclin domain-containing protein [Myxococcota bacterium]|nr:fasciclin domain-containing protein [Myxococcota bacterium]